MITNITIGNIEYKSRIGKLDFKRIEILYNNEIGYFVHNVKNKLIDKITKEQFDSLDIPIRKLLNNQLKNG